MASGGALRRAQIVQQENQQKRGEQIRGEREVETADQGEVGILRVGFVNLSFQCECPDVVLPGRSIALAQRGECEIRRRIVG